MRSTLCPSLALAFAGLVFLCAIPPACAGDGEGTVCILSPDRLTAGTRATVVFEFTAGDSGVAVGGGISMGLHHAAEWENMQVPSEKAAQFVEVRGAAEDNFRVAFHDWAPQGMFADKRPSGKSDNIHHQVFVARVEHVPVKPGEKGSFRAWRGRCGDPGATFERSRSSVSFRHRHRRRRRLSRTCLPAGITH